jgi:glycosyltransferase 2 family protein
VAASNHKLKFGIGLLISLIFLFLAFRKVDFGQMWESLRTANYLYLIPTVAVIFLSHFLRAFRWRYLLDPICRVDMKSLFSALLIGYAANVVTPAHLGEILRVYILSKKKALSMSATLATVVMERIIDVFSLLALMALALAIYPFPDWVVQSGYILFAATCALFFILVILKKSKSFARLSMALTHRVLPGGLAQRMDSFLDRFLSGIVPLRHWRDYITVAFLSIVIWGCYGLIFYFCLHAFGFIQAFQLAWYVSLILLVITCVAVIVPSSPGYIGPYHYLCQITLAMFSVPSGPALSYATVVHAITFLPVLLVGLVLANYEGMSFYRASLKEYPPSSFS